jgi:hypothetical protein
VGLIFTFLSDFLNYRYFSYFDDGLVGPKDGDNSLRAGTVGDIDLGSALSRPTRKNNIY